MLDKKNCRRAHTDSMGNAQSLTRTSGALDSFVAELGGDVVYERRCVYVAEINWSCTYKRV